MDLHAVRLVTAEIMSIIICVIIGYGNRFEAKRRTRRGNIYFVMLVTNVISLTADVLSWELEGKPEWIAVIYISNLLSYCLTLILLGEFTMYIGATITEKTKKKSRLITSSIHLCFFMSAIVIVMLLCGKISVIENYEAYDGPWIDAYVACCIISMVFIAVVVIANRKVLGVHDTVVSVAYIVIPLASAILCAVISELSYGYVAGTISMLELYVFIQSEENGRLDAEGKTNKYYANHDELTGLLARRAFSERIDELVTQDGTIGVIFCDVNGLKYANDHFGHIAGDKLLTDFAKKLESSFPHDEVFRTGGDEFIVFVTNGDKTEFDNKVTAFKKTLHGDNDDIACTGDEFGSRRKAEELVQMAENKMYMCKDEYHKNHPEQRRYM